MVVTRIVLAVGLGVATAVAGCGGSTTNDAAGAEPQYAQSDLARFVAVRPVTADWHWPTESETPPAPFTRDDMDVYEPKYPSQAALSQAYADAGFVESRTRTWRTVANKGSSFATLFATPDGANDAFVAGKKFARSWFTDVEHADIVDVRPDGLGERAWGVRGGTRGAQEFVEYGWRRGNVLLEVYVACAPCPSDIESAAREWAAAIDERA
jgi:hypothetical protein